MSDKQDRATEEGAAEQSADTSAEIDEASRLSGSGAESAESTSGPAAKKGGRFSFRAPFSRSGKSALPKQASGPPDAPAGRPGTSRFMDRLDNAVFFVARAVVFGLIAALTGVVAAILLRQFGDALPWSGNSQTELAALGDSLSELQDSVQSLGGRLDSAAQAADQVAVHSDELSNLKTLLDNSGAAADEISAMVQDLSDRLALAESSLSDARNEIGGIQLAMPDQGLDAQIQELEFRLAVLEETGLTDPAVPPDGSTQPVPERTLESRIAARLAAVESKIDALQSLPDTVAGDAVSETELEAVESRILALEESRQDGMDAEQLLDRLAAVEGIVGELIPADAAQVPQVRRFALIGVRSAAEIGVPYSALIGDTEIPAAEFPEVVLTHADTGIPTLENLRADFGGYARELLASPAADPDADGISGMLGRLFRIRPLTPQEGAEPSAVLSRAEEALRRNDLGGALTQVADLPDQGKEIMADWIQAAESRIAVLAALDSMLKAD